MLLKKYIGDRRFYKMIMTVAVPIMIQNGITSLVNMVDNMMVGQVGTSEMSGVAIANQLIFIVNLCLFGGVAGAGIFTAQFYGRGDEDGIRHTFRFKLYICLAIAAAGIAVFAAAGSPLVSSYLRESDTADIPAAYAAGCKYLSIMLIGLVPYSVMQAYASTMRETGSTIPPMVAGVVAVCMNLCLNNVLIFGHFGAPRMGVAGAAIATVISRFAECLIVVIWAHTHRRKLPYFRGIYRSLFIPRALVGKIIVKGTPLLINETLWAGGLAMLLSVYSARGLEAVAAYNIASTVSNVFGVVYMSLGVAISIIIGQLLGAGHYSDAREKMPRLIFFSVCVSVLVGIVMALIAPLFPQLYNTTDAVKDTAAQIMRVCALFMPVSAFTFASYFILRAGGKTIITFLFDSVTIWCLYLPLALLLINLTPMSIVAVYFLSQFIEVAKCAAGAILLKRGVWVNNIIS